MIELFVVTALVGALCFTMWAPVSWLLASAATLLAVGLLLGVPTGTWYHVALRRELLACGGLPARWWLRPNTWHDRLDAEQRGRVLPWFYAGGVGFLFTAGGCGVLAVAAARLLLLPT